MDAKSRRGIVTLFGIGLAVGGLCFLIPGLELIYYSIFGRGSETREFTIGAIALPLLSVFFGIIILVSSYQLIFQYSETKSKKLIKLLAALLGLATFSWLGNTLKPAWDHAMAAGDPGEIVLILVSVPFVYGRVAYKLILSIFKVADETVLKASCESAVEK